MPGTPSVYDEIGVPAVVNAAGTKTRIGGSLIREEAVEAMVDAAGGFARISDLQARASDLVSEVTGADAGYVASGAASAMTLGAAAAIAGDDPGAMARPPDTEGVPSEIVMARTHRTSTTTRCARPVPTSRTWARTTTTSARARERRPSRMEPVTGLRDSSHGRTE